MQKLSIKEQLLLVRDNYPDVWDRITVNNCPCGFKIGNGGDCGMGCEKCWNKALEDDK
jgi:hypothetical protein